MKLSLFHRLTTQLLHLADARLYHEADLYTTQALANADLSSSIGGLCRLRLNAAVLCAECVFPESQLWAGRLTYIQIAS